MRPKLDRLQTWREAAASTEVPSFPTLTLALYFLAERELHVRVRVAAVRREKIRYSFG